MLRELILLCETLDNGMTELNVLKPPLESLNHSSKCAQRDLEKELKSGPCFFFFSFCLSARQAFRICLRFAVVTELNNLKGFVNGGCKKTDVVAKLSELESKLAALKTKVLQRAVPRVVFSKKIGMFVFVRLTARALSV